MGLPLVFTSELSFPFLHRFHFHAVEVTQIINVFVRGRHWECGQPSWCVLSTKCCIWPTYKKKLQFTYIYILMTSMVKWLPHRFSRSCHLWSAVFDPQSGQCRKCSFSTGRLEKWHTKVKFKHFKLRGIHVCSAICRNFRVTIFFMDLYLNKFIFITMFC